MDLEKSAIQFLIDPPSLTDANRILGENWFYIVLAVALLVFLFSRMRTKHFYFVRHGKTILNEAEVHQGEDGSLNDAGKVQADIVGLYLAQFPIREICSSTFERAKETADAINARLKNIPVVYSPLLAERRNPKEVIGRSHHDPEVKRIIGLMDQSFHADDYRFSDEENFTDLKRRAAQCLDFLERRGAHEICVVTHRVFLEMLLAFMTYGSEFSAVDYTKMSFFKPTGGAGVTICSYSPWRRYGKTRGWTILTYNEKFGA